MRYSFSEQSLWVVYFYDFSVAGKVAGKWLYSSVNCLCPAYRATLLPIRWEQVKTALTFLQLRCTSYDITCRRFECFYGESMGKYGQIYGQILTTNNHEQLQDNWITLKLWRSGEPSAN